MIIDRIDIEIIKILHNLKREEEINTQYDLVKRVFLTKDEYERKKEYTRIKRKLKKLENYGIIKTILNKDKIIRELQIQNVKFKRIKFNDKSKKAICLNIGDRWSAFELS